MGLCFAELRPIGLIVDGRATVRYQYNTDHNMTLLKMVSATGDELGMFNWFAVHGTSMNNTNVLISGDNKGAASYLFEQ